MFCYLLSVISSSSQAKEESSRHEETVKKLRDVEKQRRLAAKEAEDLTVALGEKIAELDEAQRRLRRTEAQVSYIINYINCYV